MNRNGRYFPQFKLPWDDHEMEIMCQAAVAFLAGALIFAGVVDILIWLSHSSVPTVSERTAYYLTLYPWLGWFLAGLVYHLFVRHPAGPLG